MYVHIYMLVTLRNVNFRSHSGTQASLVYPCIIQGNQWRMHGVGGGKGEEGTTFLSDGGRRGEHSWAFKMYQFGGIEC